MSETMVNVRYMVDDVEAAVEWYTRHLGFSLLTNRSPAFTDVRRGSLRLLLSGPTSSAGRPMPDGERPGPGGWNTWVEPQAVAGAVEPEEVFQGDAVEPRGRTRIPRPSRAADVRRTAVHVTGHDIRLAAVERGTRGRVGRPDRVDKIVGAERLIGTP